VMIMLIPLILSIENQNNGRLIDHPAYYLSKTRRSVVANPA
jgi:hypothetical protein